MKRIVTLILISVVFTTTTQNVRHIETINDSWNFYKGKIEKPLSTVTNVGWEKVDLPHSWNTQDILDAEDGYYRGEMDGIKKQ